MANETNPPGQETEANGVRKEEEEFVDSDAPAYHSDGGDGGGKKKKKSKVADLWAKLGLDVGTVLMMMKAALPPTIALAMYQADDVARTYVTLGYLMAIISILGFCIMPRAKFIQTMTMNVIGTCLGSAMSLLMLWSGVKARHHTIPAGAPPQRYNSSHSAVLGLWLFFQIYIVNSLKAKFPQLAFPTILYSILVNVAAVSGVQLQTTAQVETFVRRLLETFLTGFAIATGVSLFIIPVTCRKVVLKQTAGYIMALRGALGAHKSYFQSLEHTDMFRQQTYVRDDEGNKKKRDKKFMMKTKPEVEAVKKLTSTLTELHGKIHGDLPFAKRELAYGKLTPDDFEAMFKHLRAIMMPMVGLSSLVDLFERAAEVNHWDEDDKDVQEELRAQSVAEWNELMQFVHEPFAGIIQAMDDGLEHVSLRLQLNKPPKKKKSANQDDAEAKGDIVKPGDKDFVARLEKQIDAFYGGKETTLRHWMESKGIKVPEHFFERHQDDEDLSLQPVITRERYQRQLYVVLYVVFLLHSVGRAILNFVKFADEKDQAVAKNKIIAPGTKRFKKWIASIFKSQDSNDNDETTIAGLERNNITIYMGSAYNSKKDPEHLPPANAWERFGNFIRGITGFLRSPESSFGFRCACATLSIAIIAFLRDTQTFFIKQRLIWAMIMVAISMVPTSGQSVFTFVLRIIGTVIATIVAWLIWYIPAQHTAGIIVFLWVFVALGFYVPLKRMDLVIVGLISVVTATMIVGYELEVRKIGIQAASSNGQPYYPIYELGPYRLATVVGGLAVAFFWTFFPYPITEHSALRQKLGCTLYLAANLYSIMHETVKGRIRGDIGDETDKTSPGHKLTKAKNKVFAKQMLALQGLKMHAKMVKWEFPLGGKFPRKEYEAIIEHVTNITNYTALLGYASATFLDPSLTDNSDESLTQWFQDFRKLVGTANVTSHEVTSILALLSSAIINGQPLPPYLKAPEPYALTRRLASVDQDILSLKHIAEPGYAAFAVVQISTRCIHMDVERLLVAVKKLVGELDFSFHVVSTQSGSEASSSTTLVRTGTGRSKQD